jgi:hypothetical protein
MARRESQLGTALAFPLSEKLVASPSFSVRNDFLHIHTSHLWHEDWLICESQPTLVPTPLPFSFLHHLEKNTAIDSRFPLTS